MVWRRLRSFFRWDGSRLNRRILWFVEMLFVMSLWYVYILECQNGHLYTGITNDLEKRLKAHQKGRGAKYTKVFGVRGMVYNEEAGTKVEAMKREREIKCWPRKRKLALINK